VIRAIHCRFLHGETGAEWIARFRREVRAAGHRLHLRIIVISKRSEEIDVYCIIMEYVRILEMCEYLEDRQPLPLANAMAVIAQVLQTLSHAPHERGGASQYQACQYHSAIGWTFEGNRYWYRLAGDCCRNDLGWDERGHAKLHGAGAVSG
jgi:hypothetical protein